MNVSILIITRNRSADLAKTLESLRGVQVPAELKVELIVVDNGSTDGTWNLVQNFDAGTLPLRAVAEPRPGQTKGRNRGMAEAAGEVILFTDDDVRPPANWISGMSDPIFSGKAEAVCGGVELAPHLLRPWMTPTHRSWLAATDWLERGKPTSMVGANMAFSRKVMEKVPAFDEELGPGASGFGDDGLFSSQVIEAGFPIFDAMDVCIEHHPDPNRLDRASWIKAAEGRGRSQAYRGHHWEHWGCRMGALKVMKAQWNLSKWRKQHAALMTPEGCSLEELDLVFQLEMVRSHLKESKRVRNYDKRGLVKLRSL